MAKLHLQKGQLLLYCIHGTFLQFAINFTQKDVFVSLPLLEKIGWRVQLKVIRTVCMVKIWYIKLYIIFSSVRAFGKKNKKLIISEKNVRKIQTTFVHRSLPNYKVTGSRPFSIFIS
jgi:hypothetical protein